MAVDAVRLASQQYAGQTLWAKPKQPLETRALQSILFGVKNMLISKEWGFDKQGLWVDTSEMLLKCGEDKVISVSVHQWLPLVDYGDDWETYLRPEGANDTIFELIKAVSDKLSRAVAPRKGLGKGKSIAGR